MFLQPWRAFLRRITMTKLRDYQEVAVQKGVEFLLARTTSTKAGDNGIIVAPTAAGKSHMIAAIAERVKCPVVVMQPSKELLTQNYGKFTANGLEASIFSASMNEKQIGRVTFCTPGSVKNIGERFVNSVVIIDECHLTPPDPSSMVGKFMKQAKIKKALGLTATPFRLDVSELKFITRQQPKMFGSIIHCIQVSEMTSRGYWSPLKYKSISFEESLLRLNSAGVEYTEKSMKEAYEANNVEGTISHIIRVAREHGRRSIIVFVPSVAEATAAASRVKGARAVWGDMPSDERDEVIKGFKSGEIDCVFNVNVLAVGFDHPGVDCIIMARPTRSLAWYYQAVGRGTRIDPTGAKKDCWVYDVSGNFERFGRVENITVENVPSYGWGVFGTAQSRLFTNVFMWDDKVWTRDNCHLLKDYKQAMYQSGTANPWGR